MARAGIALLFLTSPAESHCYSVWHYNFPQHCNHPDLYPQRLKRTASIPTPPARELEIPLPALEWVACPDGDERLLGIAKLRDLGLGQ